MITLHDVIPLLFEAYPETRNKFLDEGGEMVDEEGRPLPYILFPEWRDRYVVYELSQFGVSSSLRAALAFVEQVSQQGDYEARNLICIEIGEVFSSRPDVRRLMSPATQFLVMQSACAAAGRLYSHVAADGWSGVSESGLLRRADIDWWLEAGMQEVITAASAAVAAVAGSDAPSLPWPTVAPAADMAAANWPRVLAGLVEQAQRERATGDARRARAYAAYALEGVREWERCKAWGLV